MKGNGDCGVPGRVDNQKEGRMVCPAAMKEQKKQYPGRGEKSMSPADSLSAYEIIFLHAINTQFHSLI